MIINYQLMYYLHKYEQHIKTQSTIKSNLNINLSQLPKLKLHDQSKIYTTHYLCSEMKHLILFYKYA